MSGITSNQKGSAQQKTNNFLKAKQINRKKKKKHKTPTN